MGHKPDLWYIQAEERALLSTLKQIEEIDTYGVYGGWSGTLSEVRTPGSYKTRTQWKHISEQ